MKSETKAITRRMVQRPFMDPATFNRLRRGDVVVAEADGSGGVIDERGGSWFPLSDLELDTDPGLTEGTQGVLRLVCGAVEFETDGEVRQKREVESSRVEEARKAMLTAAVRKKAEAEGRAAEATVFNSSLAMPFAWRPAEAIRVGWLTPESNGSGTGRMTVVHIMLEEPFERGRLRRRAGQLLCPARPRDLEGGWHSGESVEVLRVTCPRCIEAGRRILLKP